MDDMPWGVKLGCKYRDTVTGYEGVAIGRFEYLSGCVRIELERADKDGKPESFVFDVQRLAHVECAASPPAPTVVSHARVGGPQDRTPPPR